MRIRIATFNVENLFSRASAMNFTRLETGAPVLALVSELDPLLAKAEYSPADKQRIKAILEEGHVDNRPGEPRRQFYIQEVRGNLYTRPPAAAANRTVVRIDAKGRGAWTGWIEMERELLPESAVLNTGRVIGAIKPHVLCLVEVENRPVLEQFSRSVLEGAGFLRGSARLRHNMLIDGNDDRGIDLGLLSRYPISSVRSHIADPNPTGRGNVFSRDCPEYEIELPGGKRLFMLCNHFKSQGYGAQADNDRRRKNQAARVREILTNRYDLARDLVVVAGDLNGSPDSLPLAPLLTTPHLTSILSLLPAGEERWTYKSGQEIDYLLVSEPLRAAFAGAGIERRGIFSRTNFSGRFPHFPEVRSAQDNASDHAAVFADFNL